MLDLSGPLSHWNDTKRRGRMQNIEKHLASSLGLKELGLHVDPA